MYFTFHSTMQSQTGQITDNRIWKPVFGSGTNPVTMLLKHLPSICLFLSMVCLSAELAVAQQGYEFGIRFEPQQFRSQTFNGFSFNQQNFRQRSTQPIQFSSIEFPSFNSSVIRKDYYEGLEEDRSTSTRGNRRVHRTSTAADLQFVFRDRSPSGSRLAGQTTLVLNTRQQLASSRGSFGTTARQIRRGKTNSNRATLLARQPFLDSSRRQIASQSLRPTYKDSSVRLGIAADRFSGPSRVTDRWRLGEGRVLR